MFQLIIAIIAIALVAVLAVASLYYGGTAFSSGSVKAAASTVVSQAQQISAADVLYQNENGGTVAAAITDLAPTYLASVPVLSTNIGGAAAAWALATDGSVSNTVKSQEICNAINAQTGFTDPGSLTDAASVVGALGSAQYGCAATTTPAGFTFVYR